MSKQLEDQEARAITDCTAALKRRSLRKTTSGQTYYHYLTPMQADRVLAHLRRRFVEEKNNNR